MAAKHQIGFHGSPAKTDDVTKTQAKFLTLAQLSEVLGLSERWIEFHRIGGRIPVVYDSGWRFPAEKAVEAAIAIAQCSFKSNHEE